LLIAEQRAVGFNPAWSLAFLYPPEFSSNSLRNLLKYSTLVALTLISFIFYRYSFSNSSIAFFAFLKFSFPSQVSNSAVNPFHHTKYLFFPLIFYLFSILSTFYSSSPLIITGGGCSFFCPFTCST